MRRFRSTSMSQRCLLQIRHSWPMNLRPTRVRCSACATRQVRRLGHNRIGDKVAGRFRKKRLIPGHVSERQSSRGFGFKSHRRSHAIITASRLVLPQGNLRPKASSSEGQLESGPMTGPGGLSWPSHGLPQEALRRQIAAVPRKQAAARPQKGPSRSLRPPDGGPRNFEAAQARQTAQE